MNRLSWKNVKTYNPELLRKRINFIKKNMVYTMPLFGREKRLLIKYADKNNLPHSEMFGFRNMIQIKHDMDHGKEYGKKIDQVKNNFRNLIKKNENNDLENKIEKFIKSSDIPVNILLKIIYKTPEYKTYRIGNIPYIIYLDNLLKKRNKETRIKSRKFELSLEKYLDENNIEYLTEQDIIANNIHKLTPDILFINPIIIELNGSEFLIHWMDAKNYTLTKTSYKLYGIDKQASKYYQAFGQGALVFHYGYDKTMKIPGTIILDGSFLDKQ
ncbi:hypothetical protein [Powai lake megavirus]|uniref:TPD domain-containing protein n=1 Tax=Powai lake megavirus TaxID=1842663 RepID=A0A167RJG3_9VIRU|nr:hypothetical protein QJ849_gp595 [Powai lake megavirus]ANB50757.1 hypothetical protein [Powai lake megavirus]